MSCQGNNLHISDKNNSYYFIKPSETPKDAVKFMGYNLQNSLVTDNNIEYPEYHSEIRSPCIVDLFNQIQPIIAAVVEFSPLQAQQLKKSLPSLR